MPDSTPPHRRPPKAPSPAIRAFVLLAACALPWLFGAQPAAAAGPAFAFAPAPATLQLQAGAKSGTATLVLTATPAVAGTDTPEVVDAGVPGVSSIDVRFQADKPKKGPDNTLWLVHVTVANAPPVIDQQRLAHVTLGSQGEALVQYKLTNLNSSFRWTVQPPPTAWSLATGRRIPLAITVGSVPATGVHLVSCGLVEKTNGRHLDCGHLELCKAPTDGAKVASIDCGRSLHLEAQTAHPLLLRVRDDFQEPGSYSGTVTIGANEVVDGALLTPMQMTVNSTTDTRREIGVLVILLGIGAAFWVTAYRRNKMARDQALIPAALLGKKLKDLEGILGKSPVPATSWKPTETCKQIHALLRSLSPKCLARKNFIPASFPNPAATVDATGYPSFLQSLNGPISLLTTIVQEGLQVAWAHWKSASSHQKAEIESVLHEIDGLSANLDLPLAQVQSQIQDFLTHLQEPVKSQVETLAASVQAQRQPPSVEVLNLDISRLNLYGWAAWLVLTLIVGSVALIFLNPAFGTLSDYVQCFLWSFGIAGVGQLTTLNLGSVSNALGISLLKP
jgi:hypothetical protein